MNKISLKAIIFDLDGVIVSTDVYHEMAWKQLCQKLNLHLEDSFFNELRGVGRMEALDLILKTGELELTKDDKIRLATEKNNNYIKLLDNVTKEDILPGVTELLDTIKKRNIKSAIGSSSKNAPLILNRIGLKVSFDCIVDGNAITHTKPDPEVFLKAAEHLTLPASLCLVIEDAATGVEAAKRAGMPVLAVGDAAKKKLGHKNISNLTEESVFDLFNFQ